MVLNYGMGFNPLINPNFTPQQRITQYEQQMQMQNQLQPPMQVTQTQALIKPFYVTSRQEAEASQTPFDGSMHVYINTANKEIYTKKLQNDGTAEFKIYKIEDIENENKNENNPILVKLTEHDKTLKEIKSEIERLNKYPINKNKKEGKTDE